MKGYKIPFRENPRQVNLPKDIIWSESDQTKITQEINNLMDKNAIEECEDCEGQFVSSYFLTPKADGSSRFIINLRKLNEFIDTCRFKMEDIRSVKSLLTQGAYMCSIDLKDAYFLVPIHIKHRKYLRFKFKNKLFQFTCLPFGLSTSPYIYTKIMKPVMHKLRSMGILSVIYIDDLFLIHKSYDKCLVNVNEAINLLEHLGFAINYSKSSITPSQKCKYLGFTINSAEFRLELTEEKKCQNIANLANQFKKKDCYKIRDMARVLGILTAACPATAYGSIYCKRLERQKFLALLLNDNDYEGKIYINKAMYDDLIWWKENAQIGYNPIRTFKFALEISSDASLSGWGAHCQGSSSQGFWNQHEKQFSINYLELLAAFFALKCFVFSLHNCEVLLRMDNTSAISYINRTRGVQFPHLSELVRKIWQWCESRKIWVFASYISSKQNVEADAASRVTNIDTEWELAPEAFEILNKKWGIFTIDLFATRLNRKCRHFYSRYPQPDAEAVDAFTVWENEIFYAFPPFALIARTLQKIVADKAEGTVVVPFWPAQPWYPFFASLLSAPPIIFKPYDNLLLSPCRQRLHPLASKLTLVAGNLSRSRS